MREKSKSMLLHVLNSKHFVLLIALQEENVTIENIEDFNLTWVQFTLVWRAWIMCFTRHK